MHIPFDSEDSLRQAFAQGLERLLGRDGMGAHILVLANALFDPSVREGLGHALARDFRERAEDCRRQLALGHEPREAPDDLLVFLKLMALGDVGECAAQRRAAGPWEVQFNLLRAFRPRRMSDSVGGGSRQAFDPYAFNFNKPFLRSETFWRGELLGREVDLLYNKFPFIDLHGLLVPEREQCLPQFLSQGYHDYAWTLCHDLAPGLPGLGLGYNSYGAYASVNHLHLQMFVRDAGLPIERPQWRHNGGDRDYPAACIRFDRADEAWKYLDELHRREHPYNLLYRPGCMYCLPRARQGGYEHSPWTGGYAWYEMSGGVVAYNAGDFESLDEPAITAELGRVGVLEV